MTDEKMARRSARVFADEYQPSLEINPNGGSSPVIREQEEIQTESKSCSRDSSRSSLSLMNFGMDLSARIATNEPTGEGKTRCAFEGTLQLLTNYLVMTYLGTATGTEKNVDSRPANFGIVILGFYEAVTHRQKITSI
jgi:hypothetical protein